MSAKILKGTIVSTKMNKTCVVSVSSAKKHKIYSKRYLAHKKYSAHYENMELKEGDVVKITETKPISKTKSWIVTEVIE